MKNKIYGIIKTAHKGCFGFLAIEIQIKLKPGFCFRQKDI
jgi:hypothetical protein